MDFIPNAIETKPKKWQKCVSFFFVFYFHFTITTFRPFILSAIGVSSGSNKYFPLLIVEKDNEQLANEYETKLAKEKQNTKKDKFYQKSAKKHNCRWWTLGSLRFIHCTHPLSSMFYSFPPISPMGFHRLFRLRINEEDNDDREEEKLLAIIAFIIHIYQSVCLCAWVHDQTTTERERERISEDVWQVAASGWVELRLKSTLNWQWPGAMCYRWIAVWSVKKKKQK